MSANPPVDIAQTVTQEHPGRYTVGGSGGDGDALPVAEAELGRGGIGRVLIAYDEHIGREVALKELLPHAARASGSEPGKTSLQMTRFLREARVTGQLEHPNIVPVYELGRREDGAFYYTMKIVRGRTLGDALRDCATLADRLPLLKHFADVCDAIAYAHSRDVIHRDIKPDNIMVGEFGETVVLDWGLAKKAGHDDLRSDDMARSVELLKDASVDQTAVGTLVGTPLYMSPEQAQGHLDLMDARSDVWSLGAVLYELLTGAPPFRAPSVVDLLVKVVQGKRQPVLTKCPDAPPELAAVCERALSVDRAARYADGRALADELRAYLTGGRVGAYRYRARDLLKRFARQHKAALLVAATAAALLVGVGVVSYVNIVAERDRAQVAEQAAVESRDNAEELIGFLMGDLRERLEPSGRLDLLDSTVSAVQRYHDMQGADASDTRRGRHRATALIVAGDVAAARGRMDDARTHYAAALALRQPVAAAGDPVSLAEAAEAQRKLGAIIQAKGDLTGARAAFERALQSLSEGGSVPEVLRQRLASQQALGVLDVVQGDLAKAESDFVVAVSIAERWVAAAPDDPRARFAHSLALDQLGHTRLDLGRQEAAGEAYRRALGLRKELVAQAPGNLVWSHRLAASHDALGDVLMATGAHDEAAAAYARSVEIGRGTAAAEPGNLGWQRDLAVGYNRLGDVERARGAPEAALGHFAAALAIAERVSGAEPANTRWRRDVEVGHNRLGAAYLDAGRAEDAARAFASALVIARELAVKDATNARWRHDVAYTLSRVGDARAAGGDRDGARAALKEAQTLLEALVGEDPDNPGWAADRARVGAQLAALDDPSASLDGGPVPQIQRAGEKALPQVQRPGAAVRGQPQRKREARDAAPQIQRPPAAAAPAATPPQVQRPAPTAAPAPKPPPQVQRKSPRPKAPSKHEGGGIID